MGNAEKRRVGDRNALFFSFVVKLIRMREVNNKVVNRYIINFL